MHVLLNDDPTSFLVKLRSTKPQRQSESSRLPGIGVEQLEGTKGEGDRELGRFGFWGGARVLDFTGEEGTEPSEGRLDLNFPAEGDLSRGVAAGRPFSSSSGIGLGAFSFPFEGLLLLSSLPLFWSSFSDLVIPTSLASQRHLSRSCSCIRLMQVDSSAMPGQGKQGSATVT